jgi:hypothetical protein
MLGQTRETSITVRVEGLPAGVFAPLTVQAPGQEPRIFTTAAELAAYRSTTPGAYRITGTSFRHPSGWVDTIFDAPAPLTQTVAAGTSATLTYRFQRREGTGLMLIATTRLADDDDFSKGSVRAFLGSDLAAGRFEAVFQQIIGPRNAYGAITPDGSYYFADFWDNDRVMRLAPGQISASGKPAVASAFAPGDLEVDPEGGLWMIRGNELLGFGRPGATLPDPAPRRFTFTDPEGEPLPIHFPVFRHDGSLILLSGEGLAIIPAADLRSARPINPTWRPYGAGRSGPGVIDPAGNLWVANENGTAFRFSKEELDGEGAFSPTEYAIPLLANATAVDAEGGVLLLVRASGELYRLPPNGQAFAKIGHLGTGFEEGSVMTLNPPTEGTPAAARFPKRLAKTE